MKVFKGLSTRYLAILMLLLIGGIITLCELTIIYNNKKAFAPNAEIVYMLFFAMGL